MAGSWQWCEDELKQQGQGRALSLSDPQYHMLWVWVEKKMG